MSGKVTAGLPTPSTFVHGFFSIAQLGQFALAGVSMLARWGIPGLFGREVRADGTWDPGGVASDFFLYAIYNRTVGAAMLAVTGDEGSEVIVYCHCAARSVYGSNGTVTVFAANPSSSPVTLKLLPSASSSPPAVPRQEFVLTAPDSVGGMASQTPVLNGRVASPLALGADGSLPPMPGRYCSRGSGCEDDGLTLPPLSQGFFVLLGARATAACGAA